MKTLIVWLLFSVGGYNGGQVVPLGKFPDVQSCEFVRKNLPNRTSNTTRCIQAKIIVEDK